MSSGMRWSEDQLAAYKNRAPVAPASTPETKTTKAKAPKYRNRRCVIDGKKFDSELEAKYYQQLKLEWHAGNVLWFIRQVPFELPGGIRYRLDYLVVRAGKIIGTDVVCSELVRIEHIDCKGVLTPVSRNKIRQVEAIYNIKILLIKKSDIQI